MMDKQNKAKAVCDRIFNHWRVTDAASAAAEELAAETVVGVER